MIFLASSMSYLSEVSYLSVAEGSSGFGYAQPP